jgi:hypothetical protein
MLTIALGTLAAFYALLCIAVWAMQESLVFFPDRDVPPPSALGLPRAEEITLATADGVRVHAWFVGAGDPKAKEPPPGAARPAALVVHFHGNAGNLANRAWKLELLAKAGYASLIIDYRGYGKSADAPLSEAALYADGAAAVAWAKERARALGGVPLVYYGESLGSGVAVEMTTREPPAALVLESPYTRLPDVGAFHYWWLPVRALSRIRLASVEKVPGITTPLLVVHGERDALIPAAQGRAVFEAAGSPRKRLVIVPDAGHNESVYFDARPLLAGLEEMLARPE